MTLCVVQLYDFVCVAAGGSGVAGGCSGASAIPEVQTECSGGEVSITGSGARNVDCVLSEWGGVHLPVLCVSLYCHCAVPVVCCAVVCFSMCCAVTVRVSHVLCVCRYVVYLALLCVSCVPVTLPCRPCLFTHSHSHSHSLTITCTCCCDGIYGAQDLKISHSLTRSHSHCIVSH